jgi:hypothetical protein
MAYLTYLFIALVMMLPVGTLAHAEDGLCVVSAVAFDKDLNQLPAQGESTGTVPSRNLAKACGQDKVIGIDAAQGACQDNQDARFVALFHRIDGVDLVKSKGSRARFNDKNPAKEKATIQLRSCAYWMDQTR